MLFVCHECSAYLDLAGGSWLCWENCPEKAESARITRYRSTATSSNLHEVQQCHDVSKPSAQGPTSRASDSSFTVDGPASSGQPVICIVMATMTTITLTIIVMTTSQLWAWLSPPGSARVRRLSQTCHLSCRDSVLGPIGLTSV